MYVVVCYGYPSRLPCVDSAVFGLDDVVCYDVVVGVHCEEDV